MLYEEFHLHKDVDKHLQGNKVRYSEDTSTCKATFQDAQRDGRLYDVAVKARPTRVVGADARPTRVVGADLQKKKKHFGNLLTIAQTCKATSRDGQRDGRLYDIAVKAHPTRVIGAD
jgi:hypothetical protein